MSSIVYLEEILVPIIRDEERRARAGEVIPRLSDKGRRALEQLLYLQKDHIVDSIVKSTRHRYVQSGELKGIVDITLPTPYSYEIVHNSEAETLIAGWLVEFDSSLVPSVKIGPDCSGNAYHRPEVIVTFTPA